MTYRIRLIATSRAADQVVSCDFSKPAGLQYRAGQYGEYTLLGMARSDEEGDTREFSFASAPCEDRLTCTFRIGRSAFKTALAELPLGTEVELDAPYGSFVLPLRTSQPVVLVTGGIGITPVRSMLVQADHDRTDHQLLLIYSNKTPGQAVYLDELMRLAAGNNRITVVPTMTAPRAAEQGWRGRLGRIDAALLTRSIADPSLPVYYLCGPAEMILETRAVLTELGVDDDNIRTEEFLGY